VAEVYMKAAEKMLVDDVQDNEDIGKYGAEWISRTLKLENVVVKS
jgi:methylthioribose-1-phosphate isomerase